MFSLRIVSRSTATAARSLSVRRAGFSSECAPAQRLRSVLEEYRQKHYSRELPSRFRKEVVKALTKKDSSAVVEVDNLNLILSNIGRSDARLTEEELLILLQEVGAANRNNGSRSVPVEKIMQLM
jgi:hypothetical protein